jgi:hypothetical protein
MWTDHREGVHDRLGTRVDPQEKLEAEANARVSDESCARDPEVHRIHNTFEDPNQWCPRGLTQSQKGRLQKMHDLERQEEDRARKERRPKSTVWRPKEKADGVEAASVNMVFVLLMELKALSDQ